MAKKSPFPIIASSYSLGVDKTSSDETQPPESLTTAENVRYTLRGGCSTRPGFQSMATTGTGVPIRAMKTLTEYAVQFVKNGTHIYQSNNSWVTFYDIGLTLTTGEIGQFHPFKRTMHYTNGTNSYYVIFCSTLAADANTSGHILTVKSGDVSNFAASGTVYIRGIAVTYSGVSGNTLTGCSGETSAMVSGDIVTQTLAPGTANRKGSCLSDFQGQMFIGGVTGGDDSIGYMSAPYTASNPEYAYDYQANGAFQFQCPNKIVAYATGAEIILIGLKQGIEYGLGIDPTSGALLKKNVTDIHGVPNAFCMAYIENNTFAVFTGRRVILIQKDMYGTHMVDTNDNSPTNFDYKIRPILQRADSDQSGAFVHFEPARRELKVNFLVNGISQMWICNVDLKAWSLDTSKSYSCMDYFYPTQQTFAGSDNTDKIYLEDTGTTDDGLPIHHLIKTPVYVIEQGRITSEYLDLNFSGLLSGIGAVTNRIYVNNVMVLETPFTAADLITRGAMSVDTGEPVDGDEVTAVPVAGGTEQQTAYHFVFPPLEFLFIGERFQFEFEIYDEGTVFELRNSRLNGETVGELELAAF